MIRNLKGRSAAAFAARAARLSLRTSATLTAARAWTIAILPLPSLRRIRSRRAETRGAAERALRSASGATSAAVPLSAWSRPIVIEVALPAATGTRELGRLPFRRLSLRTRQRCANQPPMHRAFVFNRRLVDLVFVLRSGGNFLGKL